MADILITNGILITMDPDRRVIQNGAVATAGDRIVDVGYSEELVAKHSADKVIDARRKVVMPGLIDGHAHAGHGLVKTLGGDRGDLWYQACEQIYAQGSSKEFWYAEALLSALERLKCGTTCGVSFLGGGANIMRTDDPVFGDRHCEAVTEVGIRNFLAVGPGRPPFPRHFAHWNGSSRSDVMVSFEEQLNVSETLIQTWHKQQNPRIHICLAFPTHRPDQMTCDEAEALDLAERETEAMLNRTQLRGLLETPEGFWRRSRYPQ